MQTSEEIIAAKDAHIKELEAKVSTLESQVSSLENQLSWFKKKFFNQIVEKIAELYMRDAERQVKTAQNNILADYAELGRLRKNSSRLREENQSLNNTIDYILIQLSDSEIRIQILTSFDTPSGGHYLNDGTTGGGGGSNDSDLRWDGRKPGEDYDDYRKRCMIEAFRLASEKRGRRR